MAALTAFRSTKQYGLPPGGTVPETLQFDVAADVTIFQGALVTIDSNGNANPSAASLAGTCAGRCDPGQGGVSATTGGAAVSDSVSVTVRQGVFLWDINGTLTKAAFGSNVYCYDDHTVTAVEEATVAGVFLGLDSITGSQAMVATYWGPNTSLLSPAKLSLTSGTGAKFTITGMNAGEATLASGTVAVADTGVAAASIILLTNGGLGGTAGTLEVGTITPGTGFVINSSAGSSDTSKVNWLRIN